MSHPEKQLEFKTLVAEVLDASPAAVRRARKDRARAIVKLRHMRQAAEEERRKKVVDLLVQLGISYYAYEEFGESIPHLLRALELDPSQTHLCPYLACAYMQTEQYEQAKDLYLDALRDNPQEVWAYIGLALYYSKVERNYKQAEQLLVRAIELEPGDARAHNNLAAVYMAGERYTDAVKHMEKALLHDPGNPNAHFGRVMAYLAKGAHRQAKNALDVFARAADPTDAESAQFLVDAKAALNSIA